LTIDRSAILDFAIYAALQIVSSGTTSAAGDIAVPDVTQDISGFPPATFTGVEVNITATLAAAVLAIYDAALAAPDSAKDPIPSELGATTLAPGVYFAADGELTWNGALTFDSTADSGGLYVFTTILGVHAGPLASFTLVGGANCENVIWAVGTDVTIDDGAEVCGTFMAWEDIIVGAATVKGRLFALQNGGLVTLTNTTITPANPFSAAAAPAASSSGLTATQIAGIVVGSAAGAVVLVAVGVAVATGTGIAAGAATAAGAASAAASSAYGGLAGLVGVGKGRTRTAMSAGYGKYAKVPTKKPSA